MTRLPASERGSKPNGYLARVTIEQITSPADHRVDDFRALNDTRRQRALERPGPFGGGRLIIEGMTALTNANGGPHRVRRVLCREDRASEVRALVAPPTPVLATSAEILDEIVGFDMHRGVVASADRARPTPWTELAERCRFALVVEGINDGENMGSLCRSARAFGADALFLDSTCIDPLVRRSVRVSLGHVTRLDHARAPLPSLFEQWKGLATPCRVIALSPRGAVDLANVAPRQPNERLALVVGAEGPGLRPQTLDHCDAVAAITMAEHVDSLNVAVAAAVGMDRLRVRGGVRPNTLRDRQPS